jgi:hypothetical protein
MYRILFVPSVQFNRPYGPLPDGKPSPWASEGQFAHQFIGNKLIPRAKVKGWNADVATADYFHGDDLAPLYIIRNNIVGLANQNPRDVFLIISIHTDGTVPGARYDNLYGGRYLGDASLELMDTVSNYIERVWPQGYFFAYPSPGYILLDGYPANCIPVIFEVAGDGTDKERQALVDKQNDLADQITNGLDAYVKAHPLGSAPPPVPPPVVDYQKLYEAAKQELDLTKTALDTRRALDLAMLSRLGALQTSLASIVKDAGV